MSLKMIKHDSEEHPGWGAGSGTIDTYVYERPCGKGRVIRTKDNIPGFRDSDIVIECDECRKKYGNVSSLSELEWQGNSGSSSAAIFLQDFETMG